GVLGQRVVVDLEDVRRVVARRDGGQLVVVTVEGLPGGVDGDVRVLRLVQVERLLGHLGAGLAAPPEELDGRRRVRVVARLVLAAGGQGQRKGDRGGRQRAQHTATPDGKVVRRGVRRGGEGCRGMH